MMGRTFGFMKRGPDVHMAAKSGEPAMTRLRPSTPVSVVPAAGGEVGVTDVTATTVSGASDQLDNLPDARMAAPKPEGAAAPGPEEAKPASAGKPEQNQKGRPNRK
jgi:outer membrane protein assembly factor BamD